MTIWVKEIPDKITVKSVSVWTKPGIEIKPFIELNCIQYKDYVIVSRADADFTFFESFYNASVLIYEDFFQKISNSIIMEITYNYDYYYLKNALSAAKKDDIIYFIMKKRL